MTTEHRTPPDADGAYVEVAPALTGGVSLRVRAGDSAGVAPDALPALAAYVASHLSPEARRAHAREVAAINGDAVVAAEDAETGAVWIELGACLDDTLGAARRLHAAVDAARAAGDGQ